MTARDEVDPTPVAGAGAVAQPFGAVFAASKRLEIPARKLVVCLVLAVLTHVPMLPWSRIWAELLRPSDDTLEEDGEVLIPIELELDDSQPGVPPPDPKPDTPSIPPPVPTNETEPTPIADAGPPPDADKPDADKPDAATPDADKPDADKPVDKPKPHRDPVAELQGIQKISKNPNNVQIVLVGAKLRNHPVGAKMGALLPKIPQWEAFFEGSDIDPVTDIDAVVLTGPQMRVTGQVIAFLQFNVEPEKIEGSIEKIMARSKPAGAWLDDAPIKAGRANADHGDRIFAVMPEKHLLVVMPWPGPDKKARKKMTDEERTKADVDALAKAMTMLKAVKAMKVPDYTKKDYAIDISMIEPYKLTGTKDGTVKIDTGLVTLNFEPIPHELTKMHVTVYPVGNDARLELAFDAPNNADAESAAAHLNDNWPLIKTGASVKLSLDLPELSFKAKGTTVEGDVTITEDFLEKVFALGEEKVDDDRKRLKK